MRPEPARHENLTALQRAIIEVNSFNAQHSSGMQLGKCIFGITSAIFNDGEDARPAVKLQEPLLAIAQSIFERHQSRLTPIGLELVLNPDHSDLLSLRIERLVPPSSSQSQDGIEISPEKLSLNVIDPERLLRFFKGLKQSDVASGGAQDAIAVVTAEVERCIVRAYILSYHGTGDGEHETLFSSAADISSELQRLGLKKSAALLTHHLEHVWQGDLREQLLAEQGSILPGEGFKPHSWHTDSTPEMFRKRWESALECLSSVSENPRAIAIARESHTYLMESISLATEYYRAQENNQQVPQHYRDLVPEFLELVSEIQERLLGLLPDTI